MPHIAEIIGVGTELLLGNIVNTDARDVSQALSRLGINVYFHTVVGDNPER
ncbi:MAG: competence/damage-inducible protein A, partial [Oscillospiraceae bacterium]|nr:competence/damage-inducible protein A [Oscillospiraceae bacterium]